MQWMGDYTLLFATQTGQIKYLNIVGHKQKKSRALECASHLICSHYNSSQFPVIVNSMTDRLVIANYDKDGTVEFV